jgi:uncharacterized damage-inducible protein DinB
MTQGSSGAAFPAWPEYNATLRERVGGLTEAQLAAQPSPERWPLWATLGHLACQRVFWLCDFAGAPGAETTRFTDAADDCPGDDDLEHVLSSADLVEALDSTFGIIQACLDSWTVDQLDEVITHPDWPNSPTETRGWALQRVFAHDVWHMAELNEVLTRAGLEGIDPWG